MTGHASSGDRSPYLVRCRPTGLTLVVRIAIMNIDTIGAKSGSFLSDFIRLVYFSGQFGCGFPQHHVAEYDGMRGPAHGSHRRGTLQSSSTGIFAAVRPRFPK